jgi:uncharacterized protein YgiM (DUF1202 family)
MNLVFTSGSRSFALVTLVALAVLLGGAAFAQSTAPAAKPAAPAAATPAATAAAPARAASATPAAAAAPAATPAPAAAAATAIAAAPVAPAVPEPPARPFAKGVLTGNNVNIRKGPGTEYPFYFTAPMGYEVKAVGQRGEWLEIEFPANDSSWIFKEFLQKIDDKTGIVINSNVRVRMGPGLQFDTLYYVPAGQKFQIRGTDIKGDWFRVAPMPNETAWILAQYVRLSGPLPGGGSPVVVAVETPAATAPSTVVIPTPAGTTATSAVTTVTTTREVTAIKPGVEPVTTTTTTVEEPGRPDPYAEKLAVAEKLFRAETAKDNPADWDIATLEEQYNDIDTNATSAVVRAQARTRLSQIKNLYKPIKTRAVEIGKVDEDLAARLKDLEKQRAEEITSIPAALEAPYTATGIVQKFYIKGLGGATHKLVEDETILYLLKSDVVDLKAGEAKRCGVRGRIVSIPGFNIRLIEVMSIRPLEEAPVK